MNPKNIFFEQPKIFNACSAFQPMSNHEFGCILEESSFEFSTRAIKAQNQLLESSQRIIERF
jgi:hypothetical protein